ncbi:MAG TPA: DUF1127 domain-containing protein [Casimicrobiaceae bacterium]|nr:DUF1127 domain-containing protein [Casimicrobiaceae bacterium]
MNGTLVAGTKPCTPPRWPAVVHDAWRALRALVRQLAAWHQRGRRVAADRDVLASMSDRELIDIGIPRSSVRAVAERAWLRDYPC